MTFYFKDDFNQSKENEEAELLQKKIKELRPDDIQRLFEQGKVVNGERLWCS